MIQKSWKITLATLATLIMSGCTLSQSEIQLQSDKAVVLNPSDSNKKVMIVNIVDKRIFEVEPKSPSTPSLAHRKDLNNKSITSSAVGRKRAGFGKGGGNVVLPKNQTVETVVRRVVEDAFKKKGYQVVHTPGKGVTQVNVDINKFWFWLTNEFWSIALEAEADLVLSANNPVLIKNPIHVKGYTKLHTQMGVDSKFVNTLKKALDVLEINVQKSIK